jgi:hypothetical protein
MPFAAVSDAAYPPVAGELEEATMSKTRSGRDKDMQGEGNREADRRYRRGVRKTVEETTEEERLARAGSLTGREAREAEEAEEEGRSRARE